MRYQSATCIADFKRCPTLFYLRHVRRLAPIETPEALRQGTNWHKCLEILKDPQFKDKAAASEALFAHMNKQYAEKPVSVDLDAWAVEQTILSFGAVAWEWYWQNDACETVAREVSFKRNLNTLHGRTGKIDRIVRRGSSLLIGEYKTTSKSIDTDSDYWKSLYRNTQVTLYILEARIAQQAGKLKGVPKTPLISGVLYDVFYKPKIRPKKLTQADTKKFLETGKYYTDDFVVVGDDPPTVNGVIPEIIPGAKEGAFAIRETLDMYGARLIEEFRTTPEKYFARREIARTNAELEAADIEYAKLARLMDFMEQRKLWYKIPTQCDSFGRCSFCPICDHDLDVTKEIPDGFRRR